MNPFDLSGKTSSSLSFLVAGEGGACYGKPTGANVFYYRKKPEAGCLKLITSSQVPGITGSWLILRSTWISIRLSGNYQCLTESFTVQAFPIFRRQGSSSRRSCCESLRYQLQCFRPAYQSVAGKAETEEENPCSAPFISTDFHALCFRRRDDISTRDYLQSYAKVLAMELPREAYAPTASPCFCQDPDA